MEPEVTEAPAPETTEAPKGLDAIISAAIEKNPLEDTPAAAPVEAPATDSERARDDKGRFTKTATEASPETAEVAAPPTASETPVEQAPPLDPPAHYNAEQKKAFATLPREAQEYWVRTEKEREADFTRRSQEAAEVKRTAEPYLKAIAPYQQYLQQIAPSVGQTPDQMINSILAAEYALRTGNPQTKASTLVQLAQSYGINLQAILNGQVPVSQPQQQAPIHPQILQRIQEHDRILAEQQRERELANAKQQIDAFEHEKDEAGQPKYPYFNKVRAVMASIVQSGQAENMADAYALAVAPIKDVIDREVKAAEAERTAALEKAKKAAPVKSSSGAAPKGSVTPKGLDAHIQAAMDKHGLGV